MTFVKTSNPFAKSIDGIINELFNEFPATLGKAVREDVFNFPPVNITEKADFYLLEASAPGFEKGDFSAKLEGTILTISAEKKIEAKSEADKIIRNEFSTKSFKRNFTVDEKIDATNINAKYENGILHVTLFKKAEVKVAAKDITIQ